MCVGISLTCMSVNHLCASCPQRPENLVGYSGTRATDSCELPQSVGRRVQVCARNCWVIFPNPSTFFILQSFVETLKAYAVPIVQSLSWEHRCEWLGLVVQPWLCGESDNPWPGKMPPSLPRTTFFPLALHFLCLAHLETVSHIRLPSHSSIHSPIYPSTEHPSVIHPSVYTPICSYTYPIHSPT